MSEILWERDAALDRPIVVVAFKGLFDAGQAATSALSWLRDRNPDERIATTDPETFYDFQQERPEVRLRDDGSRYVVWPENDWHALHLERPGRDLVVCAGVEPHLRWRAFCDGIVEVTRRTGSDMVVTIGSMVGLVPHSRPFPVTGSSTTRALAERLGLGVPSYEGPTGVIGALHDVLGREHIPTISLRVSIPHYVPAPPNPKATRALLQRFEQVTGARTGFTHMDGLAADWEHQVDSAATDDPQVAGYVRKLEAQYDETETLPSGDDLAAELEAYLREHREE
jgi:hypothetical protein